MKSPLTRLAIAVMAAAVVTGWPANALAKCQSFRPVDYNDIDGVLYTVGYRAIDGAWKGLDGYQPQRSADYQPNELSESNFWAFWDRDTQFGRYMQFSLKGHTGDFNLAVTLPQVVDLLRRDHFYDLSPPFDAITDTYYLVLTVRRCSVVTRIIIPNTAETRTDAATHKIFSDLLELVDRSNKDQNSDTPTPFAEQLMFDQ